MSLDNFDPLELEPDFTLHATRYTTGATNGGTIDVGLCRKVHVIADIGAVAGGGTATFVVQTNANGAMGSPTTIGLTGNMANLSGAKGVGTYEGYFEFTNERYVRVNVTVAGTSADLGVVVTGHDSRRRPERASMHNG